MPAINVEQYKANLQFMEARIQIAERILAAHLERGLQERNHAVASWKSQGYIVASPYLKAMEEDCEARADDQRVLIAQMKSQATMMRAAIEEAQHNGLERRIVS